MTLDEFKALIEYHYARTKSLDKAKEKAMATLGGQTLVDEDGEPVDVEQIDLQLADDEADDAPDDAEGNAVDGEDEDEDEDDKKSRKAHTPARKGRAASITLAGHTAARRPKRNKSFRSSLDDDPQAGFESFGEFAVAVKRYVQHPHNIDLRLKHLTGVRGKAAATTTMSGTIGADGGFAVPTAFRRGIMGHALGEGSLFSFCSKLATAGNQLNVPVTEETPFQTDGINAEWRGENTAGTQTKPILDQARVDLHSLIAIVPATNELLEDGPEAVDGILRDRVPRVLRFKVDNAILNGTGVKQPLGIRNSGALKTVTRVTATGIAIDEVADLLAALPPEALTSAVWVTHSTVIPDIVKMQVGNFPVFMGQGTLPSQSSPAGGNMMGRPLVIHEAAQARDTAGDLALHDFSQYLCVLKASTSTVDGALTVDASPHLFFDAHATAFKFVLRIGGQPWMSSTITQNNGSGTLSPFAEIGAT